MKGTPLVVSATLQDILGKELCTALTGWVHGCSRTGARILISTTKVCCPLAIEHAASYFFGRIAPLFEGSWSLDKRVVVNEEMYNEYSERMANDEYKLSSEDYPKLVNCQPDFKLPNGIAKLVMKSYSELVVVKSQNDQRRTKRNKMTVLRDSLDMLRDVLPSDTWEKLIVPLMEEDVVASTIKLKKKSPDSNVEQWRKIVPAGVSVSDEVLARIPAGGLETPVLLEMARLGDFGPELASMSGSHGLKGIQGKGIWVFSKTSRGRAKN